MLYRQENPHGGDLYSRPVALDFSANINPYGTPEAVRQAVLEALDQLQHYPDPYCRELVAAIAAFEELPESTILCGSGAAELIYSYVRALRPKKALLLAPTFAEYQAALEAQGCAVQQFFLKEEENFALTEALLPVLWQSGAELLIVCNPNNPTGQLIEPKLLEKICLGCQERGIHLLLDECFLDLCDGGMERSLKHLLARCPKLTLLRAFTKSYGMAGLRLGYCLSADPALLEAMGEGVQPWNVSIPAQKAGVVALGQQAFVQKARDCIRAERPKLQAGLERLGLRVLPSQVNYLLFYSERELKAPLLEGYGILIRSCANYPGLGEGWYRIAVKRPEENQRLLAAVEEICHG